MQTRIIAQSSPPSQPRRLSPYHDIILSIHGLKRDTIQVAGLRSASGDEVQQLFPGGPSDALGLAIPFLHPETGRVRTVRVRPVKAPPSMGMPASLSPRGAEGLLYFPPGCRERLLGTAEPLYLAAGELEALMAWQYGLLSVGMIGAWGWRDNGPGRDSRPLPDLDLVPWQGREVIVGYDGTPASNPEVRRARHALAKELSRRGAAAVSTVQLPTLHGRRTLPNNLLNNFLAARGVEAFLALERLELPPTELPPFLEPISKLLEGPDESIEWGIEGLQPVGANGWRIAGPKVGKSWDMLEEAYCLATGQAVYGHFAVPRRRRVMIIEEEDSRRRIRRRLRRLIHAHGGIPPDDDWFRYAVKQGVRLDDPAWQEVLSWEIRVFRPEFVYLDVFTRLHAQDVNDQVAMTKIVLFLDRLNREYGCAFVILHHDRKNPGGGDDHDEILGSRVLGGFAEATLFFARAKEKGTLRVKVALKDEPEDGRFEPEFLIRLTDTQDRQGTGFTYLGAPSEHKALVALRDSVKDWVLGQPTWVSVKDAAEALKCSKPTARAHLDALVDLGVLAREIQGQTARYGSPEGPAPELAVSEDAAVG